MHTHSEKLQVKKTHNEYKQFKPQEAKQQDHKLHTHVCAVSYTHLTLPTKTLV